MKDLEIAFLDDMRKSGTILDILTVVGMWYFGIIKDCDAQHILLEGRGVAYEGKDILLHQQYIVAINPHHFDGKED